MKTESRSFLRSRCPGYATQIAVIKSTNESGLGLTLIRNGYMSDTFSSHAIGKNGHTFRDRSFFVRKIGANAFL